MLLRRYSTNSAHVIHRVFDSPLTRNPHKINAVSTCFAHDFHADFARSFSAGFVSRTGGVGEVGAGVRVRGGSAAVRGDADDAADLDRFFIAAALHGSNDEPSRGVAQRAPEGRGDGGDDDAGSDELGLR